MVVAFYFRLHLAYFPRPVVAIFARPEHWKENCDFYSRKAIHNHISKLRKKLRFEPDLPNYIESVAGIGYKFEQL